MEVDGKWGFRVLGLQGFRHLGFYGFRGSREPDTRNEAFKRDGSAEDLQKPLKDVAHWRLPGGGGRHMRNLERGTLTVKRAKGMGLQRVTPARRHSPGRGYVAG